MCGLKPNGDAGCGGSNAGSRGATTAGELADHSGYQTRYLPSTSDGIEEAEVWQPDREVARFDEEDVNVPRHFRAGNCSA
jgi:hypothetical protein